DQAAALRLRLRTDIDTDVRAAHRATTQFSPGTVRARVEREAVGDALGDVRARLHRPGDRHQTFAGLHRALAMDDDVLAHVFLAGRQVVVSLDVDDACDR